MTARAAGEVQHFLDRQFPPKNPAIAGALPGCGLLSRACAPAVAYPFRGPHAGVE